MSVLSRDNQNKFLQMFYVIFLQHYDQLVSRELGYSDVLSATYISIKQSGETNDFFVYVQR